MDGLDGTCFLETHSSQRLERSSESVQFTKEVLF